jgi:DNA-binding NarL/FixJ family response regulator
MTSNVTAKGWGTTSMHFVSSSNSGTSRPLPVGKLSPRETEIAALIALGRCSKEIAVSLNLAVETVETHRHNIHVKLGIKSQIFVAHYALAHGLVPNRFQSEFYGS